MKQGQSRRNISALRRQTSIGTRLTRCILSAALFALAAVNSSGAQAQCSPTNPDCRPTTPPRTGGGGSGGGGGGVGVKVDVGSAAKAVGGLFKKKKKKPVEAQVQVATAPVAQPKREVVFVSNKPVVKAAPRKTAVKAVVQPRLVQVRPVAKPRIVAAPRVSAPARTPKITRNVVRKVAVPIAVAAAVAAPAIEPEIVAELPVQEPVITPAPKPEIVELAVPVAKARVAVPQETPKPSNNFYIMIAAAVAALGAAGAAAKFMFTPKVSMNCNMPDASSQMVSNPSLTAPEVAFNVAIPGFAASAPDNLAIVA